ncbi:MAG: TRAP transporter substrate-binding protein [Reyranellaceae bacterium]
MFEKSHRYFRHSVAAAALFVLLPATASAQTKLSVVGGIGSLTQYTEIEKPFWSEELPKFSGGKLSAEIRPFTELGFKGPEVLRLVREGTITLATINTQLSAGDNAINEGMDLTGLTDDIREFRKAYEAFRPMLAKYYESIGVKLLGIWSYQAQLVYCKSEFASFKDLKGKKVRSGGAARGIFLEYLGAIPIDLSFGEVQQALQRGVVDCAITGAMSGYKASWFESAKYLSPIPLAWGTEAFVANLKYWTGLPQDVRNEIERAVKTVEERIWKQSDRETAEGIFCNTGTGQCTQGPSGKMTLVPASDADKNFRKEALIKAVLPDWGRRCGKACVEEWNKSVGPILGVAVP